MTVAAPRIVSVVIGTRNRPDTLREALASIRALEGPDLRFEILVGDNGTTPETPGVVAEFGGIYDKTHVYGCPAARNLAMRRITGEFVAFLDDDDVWLSGHIRPHIAFLDTHPDYEAVFGQVVSTDESLRPTDPPWPTELPPSGDVFTTMLSGYFPQVGATLVRARTVQNYGLMDESLIGDSDWDWQLRIARDHRIGFVKTPCVLFRQRAKGTFDKLQMTRVMYTRKIFLRHAWPNRRRWKSMREFARSFFYSRQYYYLYFAEVAAARAGAGRRFGALAAVWSAFRVFPTRAASSLVRPSTLRTAITDLFSRK